ncbi:hypothetical protein BDF21DRAFT_424364 [Thamnidium elegans]|nr:hypothetical protein BDF21DRAFT_424364 [Thamnidium elegans]
MLMVMHFFLIHDISSFSSVILLYWLVKKKWLSRFYWDDISPPFPRFIKIKRSVFFIDF